MGQGLEMVPIIKYD